MASNYISDDEMNQFRSIPFKRKADCMEAYLIGRNGRRYNMQEVGALVFGDQNYSFTVSLIHRCYNFSGQNSALYRNGCRFEQTYGYRVTRKDIEAFLKQYPNGTFQTGVTFEQFLKSRVNSGNRAAGRATAQTVNRPDRPAARPQSGKRPPANSPSMYDSEPMDREKMRRWLIAVGSIGALVLLMLLVTGGLLRYWVISIIVFLLTLGAFSMVKEM